MYTYTYAENFPPSTLPELLQFWHVYLFVVHMCRDSSGRDFGLKVVLGIVNQSLRFVTLWLATRLLLCMGWL